MVIALAVITVFCFLPKENSGQCVAEIYQNGKRIETLDLGKDRTLAVDGNYHNTVTVRDGKVAITASPGRSIVCLPNGVEVRVVGQSSDVDFVVG